MSESREVRELARQIEELRQLVLQRGPQLGHSSMENGSIGEYDSTGQLVARYGTQWDGTHVSASLAGPTPPAPAGVDGVSIPTGIAVRWDGTWTGGSSVVAPSDFTRAEVHVSTDPNLPGFGILFSTYRGSIESPRGGEVQIAGLLSNTDYWICVTARTQSGKFSAPSAVYGPIRTGQIQADHLAIDLEAIGGNTIFRQPAAPGGEHKIGDLWLRSTDNIPHRWEGDPAAWVESRDTGIASALNTAFAAEQAAELKSKIWPDTTQPTGLTVDDTGDLWLDPADGNRQYMWDGDSWSPRLIGNSAIQPNSLVASDVVATGTVTAALFEAVMVIATTIILGDEQANHVHMDSLGIKIYSLNPDGIPVLTGSWGGPSADRFVITDPATGGTLAAITPDGVSSPSVSTDRLTIAGNSLDYLLDQGPRGLMIRGGVEASTPSTTTAAGVFDVEFTAEPGRAYRISTSTLNLSPSTTSTFGYASLICRPSSEGPPTVSMGKTLVAGRGQSVIAGGVESFSLTRTVSFNELFSGTPPTIPTKVRILLTYGVISGGGSVLLFGASTYPIHLYIEDAGVERPFTGVANLGAGTTATPVSQYQTDFAATWQRTWQTHTNTPRGSADDLIQGYSSNYPSGGINIGQAGFPDLTPSLAGSTIHWAALFVYSSHWYYDAGGTVLLGGHAYLNPPATKPADWQLNALQSAGHPKGGGKWIYLPASWFNGLATGATRGFTFGDGASTFQEYYGRIVGDPADSRRPVLRVNYSK